MNREAAIIKLITDLVSIQDKLEERIKNLEAVLRNERTNNSEKAGELK